MATILPFTIYSSTNLPAPTMVSVRTFHLATSLQSYWTTFVVLPDEQSNRPHPEPDSWSERRL